MHFSSKVSPSLCKRGFVFRDGRKQISRNQYRQEAFKPIVRYFRILLKLKNCIYISVFILVDPICGIVFYSVMPIAQLPSAFLRK